MPPKKLGPFESVIGKHHKIRAMWMRKSGDVTKHNAV